MNPQIALLICFLGIACLFYLDRDGSARPSSALWIPVLWLGISSSRALSVWFGIAPPENVQMEGSPIDRLFYQILLVAGILVLVRRHRRSIALLKVNWLLVLYFSYCLLSVFWSEFPGVSLKRWFKAIGDLVMVLVVATDAQPAAALKHLLSRLGFVLLPTSIVLIRYFGKLGRGYTSDGSPMNTGVATNKNMLGVITFLLLLGALWRVISLLENRQEPARCRRLWAQLTLLAIAIWVLRLADSATSIACAIVGGLVMIVIRAKGMRGRPRAVHALLLSILLAGGITLLFVGRGGIAQALGREEHLSGRTEIWAAVLAAGTNPMVGAGFESFWITPEYKSKFLRHLVGWQHPERLNEAHNGYFEVYLQLGWVGVIMIALVLTGGYAASVAAFRLDFEVGSLMVVYVVTVAIYSVTEAGFRMLFSPWVFLLLAIVTSRRVRAGAGEMASAVPRGPAGAM